MVECVHAAIIAEESTRETGTGTATGGGNKSNRPGTVQAGEDERRFGPGRPDAHFPAAPANSSRSLSRSSSKRRASSGRRKRRSTRLAQAAAKRRRYSSKLP